MENEKFFDRLTKVLNFGIKLLSLNGSISGSYKLTRLFGSIVMIHIIFLIIIAAFIDTKYNELEISHMTEAAATFLTVVRTIFYMNLLNFWCSEWQRLVEKIISERDAMKGKLELWMLTLSYCKREFIAIMVYVSGSYPISMLSAVSNLMFQVNEYRVPIKVFMPLLPSEFDAINWLFNYATQFLVIIIGSLFFYTYFPLTLVVINHTCWGIDATILMVRKMKAAVEENPGKEGEKKGKKQDKKQDKKEGDKQDEKRRLVTVQLEEIIEMTLQVQDWMSDVQNLLRINFLVEFTVLSFLFCMCIFTVSVNFFASMFILLLMYVVLFQLFVYCFMGTRVTSRIESLAEALYDADWYLMDVKQQKDLQLILLMVQNMHGYDGVFNAVSLETFQWVLQFSYSLFTFLESL